MTTRTNPINDTITSEERAHTRAHFLQDFLSGERYYESEEQASRIPRECALHLLTCLGWSLDTPKESGVCLVRSAQARGRRLLPPLLPERLQGRQRTWIQRDGSLTRAEEISHSLSLSSPLGSTKSLLPAPERRMSPGPTSRIHSRDNSHPDL